MKTFDLFQKVTVESSSRPTILGALLSLIAIFLMFFIFFKQAYEFFFKPLIKKDTIIFQDEDGSGMINANIGMTFHNLPCYIISIDQEDLLGHHKMNIDDTVVKTPIDSNGNPNGFVFDPHRTSELTKAINDRNGCIITGSVPISKVKGDIHFSFHAYREIYAYLFNNNMSTKITVEHSFSLLNFGNEEELKQILKNFDMSDQEANFNRVKTLPNYKGFDYSYDYDYYIKIIPQVFHNEYNSHKHIAYQYTLTHKASKRNDDLRMPIILINYDYSSVGMKYTLQKRYLFHFLTDICALIGGVFVIFNILNNVFVGLVNEQDEKK